jgi:hypothetical protein
MHDTQRYRDNAAECLLNALDAAKIATRSRPRNIPDLLGAPRQPRVPIRREMAGQDQ